MKAILSYAPNQDRGQLEKHCRAWLRKDLRSFMTKFADLEKAHLVTTQRQPKEEEADEEYDEDSERETFEEYRQRTDTQRSR